jgi:hypothetical protein
MSSCFPVPEHLSGEGVNAIVYALQFEISFPELLE